MQYIPLWKKVQSSFTYYRLLFKLFKHKWSCVCITFNITEVGYFDKVCFHGQSMLHVHRNCFLNRFYAQNSIMTLITTSCWNFNGLYTRINDILTCSMRQIITIFDVHLNASLIWQNWLSSVRLYMILFSLSLCYKLFQLVLNTELHNFTLCIGVATTKAYPTAAHSYRC